MSLLPDLNPEGVLPPGDYALTVTQLKVSPLVSGPADGSMQKRGP